jgi:hypothetical protein
MQVIPNEIPTLINGSTYNWAQIRIQLSNMTLPLVGVNSISYSQSREFEHVYGAGDAPIARSSGNVSYEASITLLKDEVKRLQDAAPLGDITLMSPFEIIVSYRSDILDKITTETLKNVQFTSNATSISQNDKSISVELPLIISGIKRGNNPFN